MNLINLIKSAKKKNIIFLLAVFLIGIIFLLPYGAHLDQDSELSILYSNIYTYFDKLNIKGTFFQEMQSAGIIDIRENTDRDHGTAVFYIVAWVFKVNQKSPFLGNLLLHFYIYIFCFAGACCLYYLIGKLFNFRTAAISMALYFFSPRIFAQMHYNNKDVIILAMACMIYYCGWLLLTETRWKHVFFFALIWAFLTNMKIIGFFIGGGIGLYVLIYKIWNRQFDKQLLAKIAACFFITGLIFYLITPAVWGDVEGYIAYNLEEAKNYRWYDYLLFDGNMYSKLTTGIPRRYLIMMILMTTPAGVIILCASGIICILADLMRKNAENVRTSGYSLWVFFCGMIPLAYAVVGGATVYNGWRHFYFVYPSIIVGAARAVYWMDRKCVRFRSAVIGGVEIYCVLLFIGICMNHPYQYAYYNLLARNYVENRFELDYWDMSFKQALEYICVFDDHSQISVSACDNPSKWGIDSQLTAIRGKERVRLVFLENWQDADYVIINRTYSAMYSIDAYQFIKEKYQLIKEFSSYGNVLCEIYKK